MATVMRANGLIMMQKGKVHTKVQIPKGSIQDIGTQDFFREKVKPRLKMDRNMKVSFI